MVTYYNRKDLVSFGNYLLSDERKHLFEQQEKNAPSDIVFDPVDDRLKNVSHADFENWLSKQKE